MIELKENVKLETQLTGKFYQENVSSIEKILGLGEELKPEDFFQQGDCALVQLGDKRFNNAPTEIKGELSKDHIILKGITNSHGLYEGEYDVYRDGKHIFIDVKTFAILDHVKGENREKGGDNHHAQYIPKGKYFFKEVLEFDHLEKIARQVID